MAPKKPKSIDRLFKKWALPPKPADKLNPLANEVSEKLAMSEELSIEDCFAAIKKSKYPALSILPRRIKLYALRNRVSLTRLSDEKLTTFLNQNPYVGVALKDLDKALLKIDSTYQSQLKDDRISISDFFNIVTEHVRLLPKTIPNTDAEKMLQSMKKIDFNLIRKLEGIKTDVLHALYKEAKKYDIQIIEPAYFEAFGKYTKYRPLADAFDKNVPGKKPTRRMIQTGKNLYEQVRLMALVDEKMMKDPFYTVSDFIKAYRGTEI